MAVGNKIFSGEPLPVMPQLPDPDLNSFHRKLLDYLRRLVGKLAQYDPGGGSSSNDGMGECISCCLKVDETVTFTDSGAGAIPFVIEWDRDIHFNSEWFEHSTTSSPEEITAVKDGVYQINLDLIHDCDKASLNFWVEVEVSGTWYRVVFSIMQSNLALTTPYVSSSMSVAIALPASTKFRLVGEVGFVYGLAPDATCHLFRANTRLNVVRVGSVSDGGTGGGLGWDGNPPTWTETPP